MPRIPTADRYRQAPARGSGPPALARVGACHAATRRVDEERSRKMHVVETPPQRGTSVQLLDTAISDLPPGVADRVARACEPVEDVRAAYIARQLETQGSDSPSVEVLIVAVELEPSPTEPGEQRTRE